MFLIRFVFAALLIAAGPLAVAQTLWPKYIAQLEHDASESPVAAALLTDVIVTAPPGSLAASKARFSGLWSGWGCQSRVCDIKLAVETVSESGATVVYAGASKESRLTERVQAVFAGDELIATLLNGTVLTFRTRNDSNGVMEFVGHNKAVIRVAGVLSQTPALVKTTERIPTPFTENGKPVALEVVIYKPSGNGPFPALMFNHGSTGNGDKPALFTSTWSSAALARFFTDKGWLVAFPRRRGRGKSDGLYDEGFEVNRSAYSCDPQLSLPGLERALSDMDAAANYLSARADVDSRRMLIGGQSRGGIAASVYAGTRPARFAGVVNFVGGWVGDDCPAPDAVNTVSFKRAGAFALPMLWLYGKNDPFYKISHSQRNFDAFVAAGGKGVFKVIDPGTRQDGHGIHATPQLWRDDMNNYLMQLGLHQTQELK